MPMGYSANEAACSTRPTISSARDDVVAASTEPTSTTASTTNSTRFLLCRSASRPINGVAAAAASRLAVTAQLTATVDASSWSAMMPSTGTTAVCKTATVRTTTLSPATSARAALTTHAPIVSTSSVLPDYVGKRQSAYKGRRGERLSLSTRRARGRNPPGSR